MTEMNPHQPGIDSLLRRSMAASVPSLPPDFDQRVMRELREQRRSSEPLDRYRRILLTGYALTSGIASAVVMRGQSLNWGPIAMMIVAPLVLLAAARWARRATHTTLPRSAN